MSFWALLGIYPSVGNLRCSIIITAKHFETLRPRNVTTCFLPHTRTIIIGVQYCWGEKRKNETTTTTTTERVGTQERKNVLACVLWHPIKTHTYLPSYQYINKQLRLLFTGTIQQTKLKVRELSAKCAKECKFIKKINKLINLHTSTFLT